MMCRSGNRGILRDTIPRNRVTVCVGTSWENATRKDIWREMVPLMVVKLFYSQRGHLHTKAWMNLRPGHISCHSKENHQNSKSEGVRNQSSDEQKLRKFGRCPCSLEISSSIINRQARNAERYDIILNKGRC